MASYSNTPESLELLTWHFISSSIAGQPFWILLGASAWRSPWGSSRIEYQIRISARLGISLSYPRLALDVNDTPQNNVDWALTCYFLPELRGENWWKEIVWFIVLADFAFAPCGCDCLPYRRLRVIYRSLTVISGHFVPFTPPPPPLALWLCPVRLVNAYPTRHPRVWEETV